MNIVSSLKKVSDYIWEIPQSFRSDMRVPARLFASEKLLGAIGKDRSLEQLVNTATLPGVERYAMAMPDIHEGYGFPIGGVVATRAEDGIISPGGVGYDINCGVRLIRSEAEVSDVQPKLEELATQMQRDVPSGLGRGGPLVLSEERLDQVMRKGVAWMLEQGYGEQDDDTYCEAKGALPDADPAFVSSRAKKRGRDQLGTIGSGNHFAEVERVDEVFDEEAAKALGLFKSQIVLLVHCGSRGLGHQVATDYIRQFMPKLSGWGIVLPDRELVGAPFKTRDGQEYYRAMNAAANFAFANRHFIMHNIRGAWQKVFGDAFGGWALVYDVAHNMAKVEHHLTRTFADDTRTHADSQRKSASSQRKSAFIVHRKGATRAFGPGNKELPEKYRAIGQPVLIPGSMGTASFVLVGTEKAEELSFATTCHGAGRMMSRTQASKQIPYDDLLRTMRAQGIVVRAGSRRGLVEEAPEAYKDVEEVVRVVHEVGIAKRVVRLKPMAEVKG